MAVSPQWATWSLRAERLEKQPGRICATIAEGVSDEGKDENKAAASNPASESAVALFAQSSRDNIYTSTWQEVEEREEQGGAAAREEDKLDLVDVDDLYDEVQAATSSVIYSASTSSSKADDKPLIDSGYYRFDPLSPVESRELHRLLKLSKYIPPSAEELEEERRLLSSAKKTLDVLGDDHHGNQHAPDTSRNRRVGNRINAETGKRIYKVGTRATGLIHKENKEAKDVLQAMCKNHLPRRHFEWILAQLTFHKVNMLGIDEVPSSRTLLREEAVDSVRKGTMEAENLAHVVRLLAEASKVDITKYDIVDPTKSARARGKPIYSVRNEMMLQSKAIFDVIRFKLFPDIFAEGEGGTSSPTVKGRSAEGSPIETKMDKRPDDREGEKTEAESVPATKQESMPHPSHPASWNTIFPTMRVFSRNAEEEKKEAKASIDEDVDEPNAVVDSRKRKGLLDDSTDSTASLKKICKDAVSKDMDTPLTGENGDVPSLSTSKLSHERTTRKSKGSSDGDFKLPLPPFWSKKKP